MPERPEITLKYRWRHTWPDRENDFVGYDGEALIGRFYIFQMPGNETAWRWFLQAEIARGGQTGHADTARAAAKALEDAYDAAKAAEG